MTENKKARITELAVAWSKANEKANALMMQNFPADYESRERLAVEISLARAEAVEARAALDK